MYLLVDTDNVSAREVGRPLLPLGNCATSVEISEQDGLQHLAMGAMALFRNPFSHGSAPQIDAVPAMEMLGLARLLFRQLDRVKAFSERASI